jgi:DNA-binding transcriptional MerR regulator
MQPLQIGQVAQLLGVTIDMLRNWDRNGLIDVPRDPTNGYRRYGAPEISRLRIIRMLSRAGYGISAILRMLVQLDQGETTDLRRALDTPGPNEDAHLNRPAKQLRETITVGLLKSARIIRSNYAALFRSSRVRMNERNRRRIDICHDNITFIGRPGLERYFRLCRSAPPGVS